LALRPQPAPDRGAKLVDGTKLKVLDPPATTMRNPVVRVASTATGRLLFDVAPLPKRPFALLPQHFAEAVAPLPITAQVWALPAVIADTPVKVAVEVDLTVVGISFCTTVLSPNWPLEFNPQQRSVPSVISAQEWLEPTARAVALVVVPSIPETCAGTSFCTVVPSPSWPLVF
jgi:hypothetical protein